MRYLPTGDLLTRWLSTQEFTSPARKPQGAPMRRPSETLVQLPQAVGHTGQEAAGHARRLGQRLLEVPLGQHDQFHVRAGLDRGVPQGGGEETDLAEVVAFLQPGDDPALAA